MREPIRVKELDDCRLRGGLQPYERRQPVTMQSHHDPRSPAGHLNQTYLSDDSKAVRSPLSKLSPFIVAERADEEGEGEGKEIAGATAQRAH